MDQLGTVSRGRSRHRPRDAAHLYGGRYPFEQTGDVKAAGLYLRDYEQTYSDAGLAQSKIWPVGTLCITIAANIAETSILGVEACFPDSVIGFVADESRADTRFIKYLFDAVLKMRFRSFTQGAAQDNLSQAKLLSIRFPVPDRVIQTKIANMLSAYDDLIENNRRRIAGRVRYVSRSKYLKDLKGWIEFRTPIPRESVAGRLLRDGSKNEDYDEIATDVWFDGGIRNRPLVEEESMVLRGWNQCLSLLWFDESYSPVRDGTDAGGDEDVLLKELDGVLPWPSKSRRR